MPHQARLRLCEVLLAALIALAPAAGLTAEITSYAIVQSDASLLVEGRTIRLFGLYIPPTGKTCRTNVRPVQCDSRAALALEFKIQGFVRCREIATNPDGSISAICYVREDGRMGYAEEDLGLWLIGQGWALALPGAPFEYIAAERIARARGFGVWGFQFDFPVRRR